MTIVIKAARIFDGRSEGLLRNSSVVVEGERIAGLIATARTPSSAESIDLGDVTLSPGFIDAHTHLTVAAEPYDQFFINLFRQHVAERAYLAARNARVTLEAGFTTVRDVGCIPGSNFVDVSLRNAIAKRLVAGPRMLVARNLIGATGGHCDFTGGLSFRATGRELDYTDGCLSSAKMSASNGSAKMSALGLRLVSTTIAFRPALLWSLESGTESLNRVRRGRFETPPRCTRISDCAARWLRRPRARTSFPGAWLGASAPHHHLVAVIRSAPPPSVHRRNRRAERSRPPRACGVS